MNLTALTFLTDMPGNITDHYMSTTTPRKLASARLQAIPALQAAKKIGIKTSIWSLHSSRSKDYFEVPTTDICFVTKMSADTQDKVEEMIIANTASIYNLKNKGAKIVTLYCDNLAIRGDKIADFYGNILNASDHIVVPTKSLEKAAKNYANPRAQTHLIEDPWQLEDECGVKSLQQEEHCRLLWFGSNANIQYLTKILESLLKNLSQTKLYELTVLGSNYSTNQISIALSKTTLKCTNWRIRLVKWNTQNQPIQLERELQRAHISLIPSDPFDPLKSGVSHNRLVDSIRGGCLTIARPMDSYKELETCCILGDDFPSLINKSVKNYDILSLQLLKHRTETLERFNPSVNSQKWVQLWRKVLQSQSQN